MEHSLSSLVRSYLAADSSELDGSDIPAAIVAGPWKLLEVVKELGESLRSEETATRARGVELLSAVVEAADKRTMDRQSTQTFTKFFVAHLSDSATLAASARALKSLTESVGFGSGEGIEVTRAALALNLTTYNQATRYTIYVLLDCLMSRSRPALLRLGTEFIKGYCDLTEGEKDPRNLLVSFAIVRVILLEFDIKDCVEPLFDITFCYFPITFTPPPDDPYGITANDLIAALRSCLSATSKFGPLALPLFLDKLQAASEKAKRQTLEALEVCWPVYGAEVAGSWASRFSEVFCIEVFHASDEETTSLALSCMRSMYATLYPDSDPDGAIEGVGVKVTQNALDELRDADKTNAGAAVRILVSLAGASDRMANFVLSLSISLLLGIYKDPDDIALRPSILNHFTPLFESARSPQPLLEHRDSLLAFLTSATRTQTTQAPGIMALVALAQVPRLLGEQEAEYVVSSINSALPAEEALEGLVRLAPLYPSILSTLTIPPLLALPSPSFSALAALSVEPHLFSQITSALLDHLQARGPAPTVFTRKVLATLRIACGRATAKPGREFLARLFSIFRLADEVVAREAAKVVALIVQGFDAQAQLDLSIALNTAFHDGDLSLLLGSAPSPVENAGDPLPLPLFTAAVLAFRPSIAVPTSDLAGYLRTFLRRSLKNPSEEVCALLGQTVNKRCPDLASFIDVNVVEYWETNVLAPGPIEQRVAALKVIAWIAKGLVVRSDPRGLNFVSQIVSLFSDAAIGREAALSLSIVAAEGGVMSKENFTVLRLLYKQRLFSTLLPQIVTGHKSSASSEIAGVFLTALSILLQHLPRSTALTELPKLLPLLTTALDLPDPRLRANVVDTLTVLAREVPTELSPSASSLVTKVLRGAVEGETVSLRLACLNFLAVLPSTMPYIDLHSQKPVVIKGLGRAIDDPKRDVRRVAVACRSAWFTFSGAV